MIGTQIVELKFGKHGCWHELHGRSVEVIDF